MPIRFDARIAQFVEFQVQNSVLYIIFFKVFLIRFAKKICLIRLFNNGAILYRCHLFLDYMRLDNQVFCVHLYENNKLDCFHSASKYI
jgi:hypothetical protein